MKGREVRFVSLLSQEDIASIPQAIIIANRHNLVLGRVFTYSPITTLIEFVGVSGTNYDKFITEVSSVIDVRSATNAEIADLLRNVPLPNLPLEGNFQTSVR